jgi:ribosomal-protein-serine acetyltransferase
VELRTAVENWRSRAIAERLGFRFKTIERKAEWLYDHHVDHAVYELVRGGQVE